MTNIKIFVREPFTLRIPGRADQRFCVGQFEVDEETASHWYTLDYAEILDTRLAKKYKAPEKVATNGVAMGHVVENINSVEIAGTVNANIVRAALPSEHVVVGST